MSASIARQVRILSLEGGGIRGAFTASVLAAFERATGKRVLDHFDLIVGTSTGGLIAIALGLGKSAAEILSFYQNAGPQIFGSNLLVRALRSVRHWVIAKHSAGPLKSSLLSFFGSDSTLEDSRARLVIPAFDATSGKPTCFKTPHHPRLRIDRARRAWEVGMATSAAPTFFPPYCSSWGTTYVDGGIWANRPSLVGIVEALQYLDYQQEEIHLLSIRTPGSQFRLPKMAINGRIPWIRKGRLIEIIFGANGAAATFDGQILLGDRFLEIAADSGISPISLDDATQLDSLKGLGEEAARTNLDRVANAFFANPVTPACFDTRA